MKKRKRFQDNVGGLQVKVYNNNIEFALKKFKQKVKDSGLLLEIKDRSYYTKPSEERRTKKKLGTIRQKMKQASLDKKYR